MRMGIIQGAAMAMARCYLGMLVLRGLWGRPMSALSAALMEKIGETTVVMMEILIMEMDAMINAKLKEDLNVHKEL